MASPDGSVTNEFMHKTTFSSEIVSYEHAQWNAAINGHVKVASLSDLLCSARKGLKE